MKKNKVGHIRILSIVAILLASSCSSTRFVPDGDALYKGSTVVLKDSSLTQHQKKGIRKELGDLIRPRPNKRIAGVPLRLLFYNMLGPKTPHKGPFGWFKYKLGEAPVLLSSVHFDYNQRLLSSYLQNDGYFSATVSADSFIHKKKGRIVFTTYAGPRYYFGKIHYPDDSSRSLQQAIAQLSKQSLLQEGAPYNLSVIKQERQRIDAVLKEEGYYYFDPDFLIAEADSTMGQHSVDIWMKVKKTILEEATKAYRIKDIYIYPNFRINAREQDSSRKDAAYYEGYHVLDRQHLYKPSLFSQSMQFQPGDLYSRSKHNQSLSRLVNLGLFKFVQNRYETIPGTDTAWLNALYYLTPFPKKSIRAEINASSKSNNLTGSSISIGWQNRNSFRSGALFSVKAGAGFEIQYSGRLQGYNTYRAGLEASLQFPRFLIPFYQLDQKGGFVPRTSLLAGYDILNKQKLYSINSFRAQWGYSWKESVYKEHTLHPISIQYLQPIYISREYDSLAARDLNLQKAIEKQFILGADYNYNINQLSGGSRRSGFYFNGNIDLSGNIAGLLTGARTYQQNPKTIFNAPFSQYLRTELDLRRYQALTPSTLLAGRFLFGLGIPYGNSTALPFVKQFFSGGNNSLRAFRSRSVGPGSYNAVDSAGILPDQSGDIKLEMNAELRTRLFSIVHGAVFADAGNVWLYRNDPNQPGGQFSNRFLSELAVGAGLGLRFDISFLVLRLDFAVPLRKPWLPAGERWVIKQFDPGNATWRKDNIIFNLAIGYPF